MNPIKLLGVVLVLSACSSQFQMAKHVGAAELTPYVGGNEAEVSFYQLINRFRGELKLQYVLQDSRLGEAARKHSEWMMGIGYLTHAGPTLGGSSYTRVVYEGVDASALISENIARGNAGARETFLQWLLSPPHLLGMIEPRYDHIGVARSDCDEENAWQCFWTTDFAQLNDGSVGDREFTVEEVARAAEAVLGPLGEARAEISLDEGTEGGNGVHSRWQRIKNRFGIPGELE